MWTATRVSWPMAWIDSGSVTTGVAEKAKRMMIATTTRRRMNPMKARILVLGIRSGSIPRRALDHVGIPVWHDGAQDDMHFACGELFSRSVLSTHLAVTVLRHIRGNVNVCTVVLCGKRKRQLVDNESRFCSR